jgi:large subunit ribosomal protein L22
MAYKYSTATDRPELVKAVAANRPISLKQSIEIANALRRRPVAAAKRVLEEAISMKKAIPYRRFVGDTGHKKSLGPGRFPVKACREIMALVQSVEAAALQKGLDSGSLVISHISAQQGSRQLHYGRQRSRMMKRTHIELVAEAKKTLEKPRKKGEPKEPAKTEPAKETPKKEEPAEAKPEEKKEPVKKEPEQAEMKPSQPKKTGSEKEEVKPKDKSKSPESSKVGPGAEKQPPKSESRKSEKAQDKSGQEKPDQGANQKPAQKSDADQPKKEGGRAEPQ